MGDAFTELKTTDRQNNNPNQERELVTARIIRLDFNNKTQAMNPSIFVNLEILLKSFGVDFFQDKIRDDFKIIEYLVQGMMDRSSGKTLTSSSSCLMLDTLRLALGYEEDMIQDETRQFFGDLFDKIN